MSCVHLSAPVDCTSGRNPSMNYELQLVMNWFWLVTYNKCTTVMVDGNKKIGGGDIGTFLYFSTQFLNVNLKLLQLLLIEVADSSEWFK